MKRQVAVFVLLCVTMPAATGTGGRHFGQLCPTRRSADSEVRGLMSDGSS